MGTGYKVMMAAVILKFFDALCHLIVPTPSSRHIPMLEPISLRAYMLMGIDSKGEQMRSAGDASL